VVEVEVVVEVKAVVVVVVVVLVLVKVVVVLVKAVVVLVKAVEVVVVVVVVKAVVVLVKAVAKGTAVKDAIVPGHQGVIIGIDLSIIQHNMYRLVHTGVDAGMVY
tara:strand:- start:544 stop:858 length:315 start_codon:yes stop_codon:yes gene_type:complete